MQSDERNRTQSGEWLRRAKSNLCFDAQPAAEKALKSVLVHLQVPFPKTHSIAEPLSLVGNGRHCDSGQYNEAASLTVYAVETRYPGWLEDVEESQYLEVVTLVAERVVLWAERSR